MWTFLAMMAAAAGQGAPDAADLQNMFRLMDRNGDGYVTADETPRVTSVRSGAGRVLAARAGGGWIERYDRNGDGRVSLREFVSGAEAEMAVYRG